MYEGLTISVCIISNKQGYVTHMLFHNIHGKSAALFESGAYSCCAADH